MTEVPESIGPERLFESDWMERLTHVQPSTPFIVYLPFALGLLATSIARGELGAWRLAELFACGALAWTLVEYLLHRFVFHFRAKRPAMRQQVYRIHGVHHAYPGARDRVVAPLVMSLPIAILVFGLSDWALGLQQALPLVAGVVAGYLDYDFTHFSVHQRKVRSRIGRLQRRRHLLHHFRCPNKNFGVTSALWDYVFGTVAHIPPRRSIG